MTSTPAKRGRPSEGVRVDVRIPSGLLAVIDAAAKRDGVTRAEMIRTMLHFYAVG